MTEIYLANYSLLPITKNSPDSISKMGVSVLNDALAKSRIDKLDLLLVSNMLSDELEGQKHLAPLIASKAGLAGLECWQVRAATASGAANLRAAYLALKSGLMENVAVLGIEIMHGQLSTPALAKALDKKTEIENDHTMISINAQIMKNYLEHYNLPYSVFANFAINAHLNAFNCGHAFLKRTFQKQEVLNSRIISDPIRLTDCSPICDGAAAILLTTNPDLAQKPLIKLLASEISTDQFRVADRKEPLALQAAVDSSQKAYKSIDLEPKDIDFFEAHDAFSIMSCLTLEACGFAEKGQGWRLAEEEKIFLNGSLPIATHGGLKARGHPIGATALYQVCEIARQLSGNAQQNQIQKSLQYGMMQSVGGAGTTIVTNIFGIG